MTMALCLLTTSCTSSFTVLTGPQLGKVFSSHT